MQGVIAKAWEEKASNKMSLTMTHDRLKQHLTRRIQRPIEQRTNFIPILIGMPGIGKSTMIRKLAAELGWVFARFDVNAQAFEENNGLPYIDVIEGGQKVAKSAPAEYLPTFATKPTLLEVGELPTAPPNVQNQIRLIIDGMFMGQQVSQHCMMIATGNPPSAEFVTGNVIDAAIEGRLDPYIVMPSPAELLAIWSRIMFPTVFRFLTANETLIESLSPRQWMMVSEKVENLVECDVPAGIIIQDIRTSFTNHKNILPLLQNFLITGGDEKLCIILGREVIEADEDKMNEVEKKITLWLGENLRGMVGTSTTDLTRVLGQLTEDEAKEFPNLGTNVIRFIEILSKNDCHDMARALMDVAYACASSSVIIPALKASRVMSDMAAKYKELKEDFAEASA